VTYEDPLTGLRNFSVEHLLAWRKRLIPAEIMDRFQTRDLFLHKIMIKPNGCKEVGAKVMLASRTSAKGATVVPIPPNLRHGHCGSSPWTPKLHAEIPRGP
jgi:hypothetical protein